MCYEGERDAGKLETTETTGTQRPQRKMMPDFVVVSLVSSISLVSVVSFNPLVPKKFHAPATPTTRHLLNVA